MTYSCAERPGIKKGEIPEKKDLPACCLYLEVIYFRPGRIEISFVPAVDNFRHFMAASLIGKGDRTFIGLVAAVAFDVYAFIWLGLDIP
jgi:hypothetical protein